MSETAQRDRSPAFPVLPLKEALERLGQFDDHFKRSPARPEKVGEAWGIGTPAYAARISAALRYYGLLDYQTQAGGRAIVVSEDGRKYLRAQQESVKKEIVSAAALRPKQIAHFWKIWGADRPADSACLDELVLNNGFSEGGARDFLKVYDATISFASLESGSVPLVNDGQVKSDRAKPEIEVGDVIQVEIDGALALPQPDRVRAVQQHEGRRWVFIETSETGIPVEQAVLVEKGSGATPASAPPKLQLSKERQIKPPAPGTRQEVITLDEGDVILMFPENLSSESYQDLADHLQLFLRKAKRRTEIRDRHKDPEYLAVRNAETARRAAQTDDEEEGV